MAKWGEINCPRCAELEAQNRLLRDAVYIDDLTVTGMADDKAALKARIEELEAKLAGAVAECERIGRLWHDAEAKLAQQDDLVQAAVAAALREAAKQAETRDAKWMREKYDISYRKKRYNLLDVHNCENKFANILSEDIEDAILDLITPDAQAALDRVVAAERGRIADLERRLKLWVPQNISETGRWPIRKGGE